MFSTKRTLSTLALIPALALGASKSLPAQEAGSEMQQDAAGAEREAAIAAATDAALSWLELVDAGDYGSSWDAAAEAFQGMVTKGQWSAAVGDARSQVDPLGDRSRTDAQYTTELPSAPAGEYVVLRFSTEASGDRTVTETVVPMKQEDGSWKVSGYFVQP